MSQMSCQLFFGRALLPEGWRQDVRISLSAGRIAAIDCDVAPNPGDERHATGVPGMPNLHSHAFQRGMAGLAEARGPTDDSFWTWREAMYRFVDRLDPEALQAIAALAYIEMLESGFTRVGEFHYLHHDRSGQHYAERAIMSAALVEAAAETGIAMTLLPVFYAHADFGGTRPQTAQRRFVHDLDGFARLLQDLTPVMAAQPDGVLGIAPHSLRAVTEAELAALVQMLPGAPIHIHIAEQVREVENCLAWSGSRPVRWLFDHADVSERWCLVHATHIDADESRAVAQLGAVVGLCPITEANLGDGIFPGRRFRDHGGRFGIGSDSNVLIDMTEELRLLEYGQRLADRGRARLADGAGASTAQSIFTAAMLGGSQALGGVGGIVIGQSADLVSIDPGHASLFGKPAARVLDALVFGAGRTAIDCVWRAGVKVVQAGAHRDRQRITQRYKRACAALID